MLTQNARKIESKAQNELLQAVLTYKEIKAKIAFLENELKASKDVIEQACAQTEDGSIIAPEFKATLSICKREVFGLKLAKAALGEELLSPYISFSEYTTLKVS